MKKYVISKIESSDDIYLCDRECKVGDIVMHFPDPSWGLTFEVIALEGDYATLKYHTHPNPEFWAIGHEREWPISNIFKIVYKVLEAPKWVEDGMSFDTESLRELREGKIAVKCKTCSTWHY